MCYQSVGKQIGSSSKKHREKAAIVGCSRISFPLFPTNWLLRSAASCGSNKGCSHKVFSTIPLRGGLFTAVPKVQEKQADFQVQRPEANNVSLFAISAQTKPVQGHSFICRYKNLRKEYPRMGNSQLVLIIPSQFVQLLLCNLREARENCFLSQQQLLWI